MFLVAAISFFLRVCELELNLSFRTLLAYSSDLGQFRKFLERHRIEKAEQVTPSVLLTFVAELRNDRRLKDNSIRRKIAVLKRFFRLLEQRDLLINNPFWKTNFSFRKRLTIPKVLSQREIVAILTAVNLNPA